MQHTNPTYQVGLPSQRTNYTLSLDIQPHRVRVLMDDVTVFAGGEDDALQWLEMFMPPDKAQEFFQAATLAA